MGNVNLGFGCFFAPFHPTNENPTLSIQRDLDLIEWLDYLGYDEAWVGEHHSGGWGIISSPEIFIAAAAERTKQIKLGTGVISLPYHNPLMVANRITQLDHMTRGRVIFGVGAGQLPTDANMMNIDTTQQRRMLGEALEAITHLLEKEEPLNMETDWFKLNNARVHLRSFTKPNIEMAIASLYSPNSMKLAGKYGLSPFSLGGMLPGDSLANLSEQWKIASQVASEYNNTMDRSKWRVVIPIHIAETREKALQEVREGGHRWIIEYFRDTHGRPVELNAKEGYEMDAFVEQGGAIIGSVEDCIQKIEQLQTMTGGFGKVIAIAYDWASTEKIKRSFELLARYVMPHFQGNLKSIQEAQLWSSTHRTDISEKWSKAQHNAMK